MYRQRLEADENVVNADEFQRATASILSANLAKEPENQGVSDLASDVFHAYRNADPATIDNVSTGRQVNKALIDWLMKSPEFGSRRTVGNTAASLLTTSMTHAILTTDDAIKQALEDQAKAEELQRKAEIEEDEAESAKDKDEEIESLEASEWMEQQAQDLINRAIERIEKIAQSALGQGMASEINEAADEAAEKVACAMRGWGLEDGDCQRIDDIETILRLAQDANSIGSKIAEMVGRLKGVAKQTIREMNAAYFGTVTEAAFTKDLSRVTDEEIAAFTSDIEVVQMDAIYRWATSGLFGWQPKQSKNRAGDILFLMDKSGSMNGNPIQTAKAIALATAKAVKEDGRHYRLTTFNTTVYEGDSITDDDNWRAHLKWAEQGATGGTNFDVALSDAIRWLSGRSKSNQKGADVLFLTDGFCRIKPATLQAWNKMAQETGARLYVICISGSIASDLESIAHSTANISYQDLIGDPESLTRKICKLLYQNGG